MNSFFLKNILKVFRLFIDLCGDNNGMCEMSV